MKVFLTVLFASLLLVSTSYAQETLKVCNEKSGLTWNMNSESDIDKYRVYASNAPIPDDPLDPTLILMEMPHTPENAVDDGNGNFSVSKKLDSTLSEGDKYFRVTAVDLTGNESAYSNEDACNYNKIPNAPTGVKVIIKF